MSTVRAAVTGICMTAVAGCASVPPVHVDVAGKAAEFRTRSLGDPGLAAFMRSARGTDRSASDARFDLRSLELIALYDAPSLAIARAKWNAAKAAIRTAGAIPNPMLTLDPAFVTGGGSAPPFFLAATLIQLVETAGKRPLRIAKAQYSAEAARFQIMTAAWQTIARVDGAAIDLAAARAKIAALDQQAVVQQLVVDTAQKRLAVGLGSSVELTVARTALTHSTLDRETVRAAKIDAFHRLVEALGVPENALPLERLDLELVSPPLSADFLHAARDAAALRRADILGGVADYATSIIESRLQKAGRVPNVEIGPSVEYDQGTKKWGVSVAGAIPIFNRNGGPIAEAQAQQRVAENQLLETQASAIGEVDRAIATYRQAVEGLAVADRLVSEQFRQLAAQRKLLAAGQSGRADMLSAQSDLALAQVGRADALATLTRARLAVELAAQAKSDGFDPASLIGVPETK